MRVIFALGLPALVVTAVASAKLQLSLYVSNMHPSVRQPVAVLVRSQQPAGGDCLLRVIAVAPGASVARTVDAFVLGTHAKEAVYGPNGPMFRRVHRARPHGLMLRLRRVGPLRFAGTLRFPSVGRWRLVVPNECAPGRDVPVADFEHRSRPLACRDPGKL